MIIKNAMVFRNNVFKTEDYFLNVPDTARVSFVIQAIIFTFSRLFVMYMYISENRDFLIRKRYAQAQGRRLAEDIPMYAPCRT